MLNRFGKLVLWLSLCFGLLLIALGAEALGNNLPDTASGQLTSLILYVSGGASIVFGGGLGWMLSDAGSR